MPVQTHQINVQGLSGGIFWSTLLAVVFFVIGFATTGWQWNYNEWVGLWSVCSSGSAHRYWREDWFQATQAMCALGLIFLLLAFMFIFLYMFVHNVSASKSLILKLFVFFAFLGVVCMVIGLGIFGNKTNSRNLHWSYAFAAVGAIFLFLAAVLGIVQMKKASII